MLTILEKNLVIKKKEGSSHDALVSNSDANQQMTIMKDGPNEEKQIVDPRVLAKMRHKGVVKHWNYIKGYGFIKNMDEGKPGPDVFVHQSVIQCDPPGGFRALVEGQEVEYDIIPGNKKGNDGMIKASNVTGPNGVRLAPPPRRRGRGRGRGGASPQGSVSTLGLYFDQNALAWTGRARGGYTVPYSYGFHQSYYDQYYTAQYNYYAQQYEPKSESTTQTTQTPSFQTYTPY